MIKKSNQISLKNRKS